uniref:Putative secreted protein n=1 Tax=Anopheles triannulatus TaxID=58253 RepID=A0A2M4B812_9DIPT
MWLPNRSTTNVLCYHHHHFVLVAFLFLDRSAVSFFVPCFAAKITNSSFLAVSACFKCTFGDSAFAE